MTDQAALDCVSDSWARHIGIISTMVRAGLWWTEDVRVGNPNGMVEMDDLVLLKVEDAARILGFGRSRTYALVASGVIPSLKVGRSIRISRRQLQRWVEQLPESAHAESSA
jgi:excisionase family DNA binding protein